MLRVIRDEFICRVKITTLHLFSAHVNVNASTNGNMDVNVNMNANVCST